VRFADLTFAFLLSNNLFFSHFLGVSEAFGPSPFKKILPRSLALGLLLLMCGGAFSLVDSVLLRPFQLSFLTDSAHLWPERREVLLHSVLLGGVLLTSSSSTGLEFPVAVLAAILGYFLSLVFLGAVFQRMARERIPLWFQGVPFSLFTAGLVWLILNGLSLQFSGAGN